MKKITLFIFLSFFCIAAIADNPRIDCTPTHSCAQIANYLRKNGEVGASPTKKDCFRCFTSEDARLTCPVNALVYTKSDPVFPVIHRCTHQPGITPGAWQRVATITFCSDSPIKNFDNLANSQNARLTDDGTKDLTNIEYAVVKNPCYMRNCIANYRYNATTKSCEPIEHEPGTIVNNVNCSEHNLPNAKECGCRYNYDNSRTCYVTKCNDGYKFGEPVNPDPNNNTWKNKYKNCIEDTEVAATAAQVEYTATASEPRDEYADIIKKIENEISEYSKKCSKYTKPQAE